MVRFIALGFLVAYACHSLQAGGEPVPSSRDHKKAIEAFRELVKKGFRADYTDIEAKFNACFQANDRVSKFDKVFETATRREDRKGQEYWKTCAVYLGNQTKRRNHVANCGCRI